VYDDCWGGGGDVLGVTEIYMKLYFACYSVIIYGQHFGNEIGLKFRRRNCFIRAVDPQLQEVVFTELLSSPFEASVSSKCRLIIQEEIKPVDAQLYCNNYNWRLHVSATN
jgi:hypothetical protein